MTRAVKLEIIHDRCQGAGLCALTAPELFDQDDEDGRIVVLDDSPAPEQQDAARRASTLCPNSVIQIVEET